MNDDNGGIHISLMTILEVVLKVVWVVALGKYIGWWAS